MTPTSCKKNTFDSWKGFPRKPYEKALDFFQQNQGTNAQKWWTNDFGFPTVISSHRGAWRICHLHELPDDVQSFSKVCWRIDAKGRTGMLRAVSWDILRVICENAICRHQITHKWILEFFILYKTCLIIHQFCHINPFFFGLKWSNMIFQHVSNLFWIQNWVVCTQKRMPSAIWDYDPHIFELELSTILKKMFRCSM